MIIGFAVAGGLLAFIPGASLLLIPLEVVMLFLIADKHDAFELPPFLAMIPPIIGVSAFLKAIAFVLHALPLVGQVANSLVAAGFISVLGFLGEKYFSYRGGILRARPTA